jgi:hypothetical protein
VVDGKVTRYTRLRRACNPALQTPFTEGFLLREKATDSPPWRPVAHFPKVLHKLLHICLQILAF